MAEYTDRRVRRTRDHLHRALIELMIERGYDRVTVSDIIDRADVGRSTFYAHYRDKDDLLLIGCTEFLRREIARTTVPGSPLGPLRVMFHLAAQYPEVHHPLIGPKATTTVLHAYRRGVADIVAELLADQSAETVAFLSWGLLGLLGTVIDPTAPVTPTAAWQRFESLALHGLTLGGADPATADDAESPAPRPPR
ncbi:TetR/AcrR family transcriptional regulator [Nocardia mangyaensis]|uniref:TetR/AcrR family transcriptional regulator n=1 Tax=Nocardia mangyaensis TaxID=2213200 RepID=UPI0026768565|nr:TetR/AcrR family transcriptional regulator [Nocardia mangyaensis]MDO3650831.1 helix-turn-helix domain-containing protein [Nocardia mangyaensis]